MSSPLCTSQPSLTLFSADCLDRSNLAQSVISEAALDDFLTAQGHDVSFGVSVETAHRLLWSQVGLEPSFPSPGVTSLLAFT